MKHEIKQNYKRKVFHFILLILTLTMFFFSASNSTTYMYDQLNRIKTVTYGDGTFITYTYDDAGNRIGMAVTAGSKIIQVTSPNGSEEWPVGSSQTISWSSTDVTGNVNILLSRTNGTTWETLFANTANDGNEPWTVTGETSNQCLIRVVSIDYGNVYDVSDGTFSITSQIPNSINVTSPNGGENWETGSNHNITWTSNVTGNVDILLSRDNGATWEILFANTANDGNESWTVIGQTSGQCLIRVVSVDFGDLYDVSNGSFNIILQAQNPLIINDPPVQGEINPNGDIDWFYFTVTTQGLFTIETSLVTLADSYIYLYGPDNSSIYIGEDDDGGQELASKITQQLNPGTYYVKVRAFDSSQVGTYTIRVFQSYDSITGRVIDSNGNGIQNVMAYVYDSSFNYITAAVTENNGNYVIKDLSTGEYKIYFFAYSAGNYISEWYNDKQSFDNADIVPVTAGQTTTLADSVLSEGGIISGRVTDSQGNGIANVYIEIIDLNQNSQNGCYTDSNGYYTIQGTPSGDYKIYFDTYNAGNFFNEWYDNKTSFNEADTVSVMSGQITNLVDAVLSPSGSFSGIVTDNQDNGIINVLVYVYDLNNNWIYTDVTNGVGYYRIPNLLSGSYKVYFSPRGLFSPSWYNGQNSFESATPVNVTIGQNTFGIDTQLNAILPITITLNDQPTHAEINSPGEMDWFSFTVTTQGTYILQTTLGTLNDSYIYLYGPNDPSLYIEVDDDDGIGLASKITRDLSPGTYYVKVRAYDVAQVGTYSIEIFQSYDAITGQVNDIYGNGIPNVWVSLYDLNYNNIESTPTDSNGHYTVRDLLTGEYKIYFDASETENYPSEWYNNKDTFENADAVTIVEGEITNINATLSNPGIIVTSPNGGESFPTGSRQEINWVSDGTLEDVKIECSFDNGASWTCIIPATNIKSSYYWIVPNTPSNNCLIRISEANQDVSLSDVSDAVFSIVSAPYITISSPNSGEKLKVGSTQQITWTSSGIGSNVKIDYSIDGGTTWTPIVASTSNDGSYDWTIPNDPSANCLIRISDIDGDPSGISNTFSIISPMSATLTLTSPNGTENLSTGSTHQITWTGTEMEKIKNVMLEYSLNNGTTWSHIIAFTANNGSFNWTVPDKPSNNCLVRISKSDSDEGPVDVSDGVFSIVSASTVKVIAPNGGEQWKAGSAYNITWESSGISDNVIIDLYRGTAFDLNIGTTPTSSGSYSWNIPGNFTLADDYKIFIHQDTIEDYSDAVFSIVERAPNNPDFNNDGKVDILWRNYTTGSNEVWYMNGGVQADTVTLPAQPDLNWRIVGTGDFNRDGKVDILWRNYSNCQNQIWYMDGVTLMNVVTLAEQKDNSNWQISGTGDFNGDGKVDILWRNLSEGRNKLWFLDEDVIIGNTGIQALDNKFMRIAGTGDFNSDGKVDILWRNYSTGSNEVWYMDGTIRTSSALLLELTELSWQIAAVGDFNGDTKPDILWRRYTDGANMIWYMDGITRIGTENITTRSDLNWRIVGNGDYKN